MKTETKKYVDGFVIPIKKKNIAAYKKMAQWGAETWMKHGALEYFECIGDDLKMKKSGGMGGLGFVKLANLKPDETVVFSWIVYKSKAHRDMVNKKVMAEMSKQSEKYKDMPMPFDMNRLSCGGFKAIVEA